MKIRPKLIPLSVNWMISPSTPQLRICVGEIDCSAEVEFLAGNHNKILRIMLEFEAGIWVAFNPSYADHEVVQESAYDWSAVFLLETGKGFAASSDRFDELWKQSGICPDPRAYEVQGSPCLEKIRVQVSDSDSYKHFLLLGHDAYVDVIAKSWRVKHSEDVTESLTRY